MQTIAHALLNTFMYVKKIHKFDFDCDKLHQDFLDAYSKVEYNWQKDIMPYYKRIGINYSKLHKLDDPLIWSCSGNGDVKALPYPPYETYDIDSIIPWFQNTYTAEVIRVVHDYFLTIGLLTTRIKYACLEPHTSVGTHIDPLSLWRYHMPVKTSKGVAMVVNGYRYEVEELSTLYAMKTNVPHSAENNSDENRVLLSFDVAKI